MNARPTTAKKKERTVSYPGVEENLASERYNERGFVIARLSDGRAVMDGTSAVEIRWGYDFARVRRYANLEEAHNSWLLLMYEDDEAVITPAFYWEQIWLSRQDAQTQPEDTE